MADMKENDLQFLKQAIGNSKRSMVEGNFPEAFNKVGGPVTGATLYVGLEPCLMCTGVIYWGGIRRVVYACSKARVNPNYYETPEDVRPLVSKFNEKIEFVHAKEFEEEALEVVRTWEKEHGF